MMREKNRLRLFFITCLLFLIIASMAMFSSNKVSLAQANNYESSEMIATIRPTSPISSDLAPDEFNFSTTYVFSNNITNEQDEDLNVVVPQGSLQWLTEGHDVQNITLYDNSNKTYDPIITDASISNREITVLLSPHQSFKLSLSFTTDLGVIFDNLSKTFVFAGNLTLTEPVPTDLEVVVPDDFTVLNCSSNSTENQDGQWVAYKWQLQPEESINLFLVFLPFRGEKTLRYVEFLADDSSPFPFPKNPGLTCTEEMVVDANSSFSIWSISPFLGVPIAFPVLTPNVTISAVNDGAGQCTPEFIGILNPNNSTGGYYYVDTPNSRVIVYPHYESISGFYEYRINVTFFVSPATESLFPLISPFWPFTYDCSVQIANITGYGTWKVNVTRADVSITLPSGTSISGANGNPLISSSDNGPVATFPIDSMNGSISGSWEVLFDVTSLKNLFIVEIPSIAVFFVLTIASWWINPESDRMRKLGIASPLVVAVGLFMYNLSLFLPANAWYAHVPIPQLFYAEPLLLLLIFIICLKKPEPTLNKQLLMSEAIVFSIAFAITYLLTGSPWSWLPSLVFGAIATVAWAAFNPIKRALTSLIAAAFAKKPKSTRSRC